MSKPTQRTIKSHTGSRRSHHALKKAHIRVDEAGNPHLAHHASPASGTYRGKKVVDVAKRNARSSKRKKSIG